MVYFTLRPAAVRFLGRRDGRIRQAPGQIIAPTR